MKTTIAYIGGGLAGFGQKWGGTQATNYALVKCLEGHPEFELKARFRGDFRNLGEVAAHLAAGGLSHVDDTSIVSLMFLGGLPPPDVIGPITRSPLKDYAGWRAAYPPEWFYRARILRLNYAEERGCEELVTLIRHGVDTEMLQPAPGRPRRWVLWAGNQRRPAKNWPLMEEIIKSTKLPRGYAFKVLTDYRVRDYWQVLEETAVLVVTSRYESFCSAAFEAMARAVPVIWRENLQGGVHEAAGWRVAYTAEAYREAILAALQGGKYLDLGLAARAYVEQHASLECMREDLAEIYREVRAKKCANGAS